jgi:hypothetical protein
VLVSERSERTAGRATAREPDGDGVWGRSPQGIVSERSERTAGADPTLSERHRAMIDFERTWWRLETPRDDVIRARFRCTADEYYAELHRVLELPEAMAHDPVVVRRFHRRRQRRRRALLDAPSGPIVERGGGAEG